MPDYDYDVIVVGGGPAGASAAKAAVKGGLRTLLVEKKKLPRTKPCSGVIMPHTESLIREYFGPMPEEVMAWPAWKGNLFHLGNGKALEVPIKQLSVWRDRLDHWLCRESGAEIWESTRLTDFAEWKDHLEVVCKRDGEEVRLTAGAMVAADGGLSQIVRKTDPLLYTFWTPNYCFQDYRRGTVDLDPEYYHLFLGKNIGGVMPTLYVKDDVIVTDTITVFGDKIDPVREQYTRWLQANHGFRPGETVATLACQGIVPCCLNRFFMGTEKMLVAGEAAGFMNMGFEGISSALATGYLAGRAIAESGGHRPGRLYRELVKPEQERTVREWHVPSLLTGKSAPELKKGLMAASPGVMLRAAYDMATWLNRAGFQYHWSVELTLRAIINRGFDFRG